MLVRLTRHTLHVLGATLAVATVVAVGLAWRLAMGPITVSFLSPTIERALARANAPYRIAFADTVIGVGGDNLVGLGVTHLRALDAEGRVFFAAPEVNVDLSFLRLLQGSLSLVSLEAVRPVVRLVRDETGALSIGPGDSGETSRAGLDALIDDVTGTPNVDRPLGGLSRLAIANGTVLFEDRMSGRQWQVADVGVVVDRDAAGVRGTITLELPFGTPSAHVDGSFAIAPNDRAVDLAVRFAGLDPTLVADQVPELAALGGIQAELTGTLHGVVTSEGALAAIEAEVWMGPGRLIVPDIYVEPVTVAGAAARVTVSPDHERIDVVRAEIDLGDVLIVGEGRVVDLGTDPWLTLEVAIDAMPAAAVVRYWPEGLGVNARDWIARSISGGTVRNATASFSAVVREIGVSDGPLNALAIEADVAGTDFAYMPTMPSLTGLDGHVSVRDFAVVVDHIVGHQGNLVVADGRVTLPRLDGSAGLTSETRIEGRLRDALILAADPGLDLPDRETMANLEADGAITATLRVDLPRFVGMARADVVFAITGDVAELALPREVPNYPLTGGAFSVSIDRETAKAVGSIAALGVPVDATWTQHFGAAAPLRSEVVLDTILDDAERATLGIPGAAIVQGLVAVRLAIEEPNEGSSRFQLVADLTGAAATLRDLSWSKARGQPGTLAATWRGGTDGATDVTAFSVAAPDLELAGSATLTGAESRVILTRAKQGLNDLAGTIAVGKDGAFAVVIDRGVADLGPYIDTIGDADEGDIPPFTLTARLQRLYLRPDAALTDVTIDARFAADRFARLAAEGIMPGGSSLTTSIGPGEGGRVFRLDAADAGDALRLFDVIETAHGGTIEIGAKIDDTDPERPATGNMVLRDFQVRDAPVLARVLSFGSFTGLVTMLEGEGIPFARAKIPFVKHGSIITIANARGAGGALGITGEGTIDLATETIDIDGTLIPAYTINSLLGEVPLLGALLIGAGGGGLFAATYTVRGPIDDPDTAVNPLATLAPGFLRDMLSFDPIPGAEVPPPENQENR